jgi:dTMP kinase
MIIVIEGGDQAGKLTQSILLEKALKKQKIKTKLFHFPDYETPIGKEIRKYLDGKRKFPPQVIHCLLAANRWEKLDAILAAEEKNSVLIMNRYYHSNLVYGLANGLKQKWLESLDEGLPKADLIILLDVTQKESFSRTPRNKIGGKIMKRDKFEKNKEFSTKISNLYRKVAKKKQWKIINATKSKIEVHEEILKIFSKKLGL